MTALADHAMTWMNSMQTASRQARVDLLFDYLKSHGQSSYDPSVSQLEHALQTAHLAQQESQLPHLVVASLLHDIGHLMLDEHDERGDFQFWFFQHNNISHTPDCMRLVAIKCVTFIFFN